MWVVPEKNYRKRRRYILRRTLAIARNRHNQRDYEKADA
jgi:hypothetical protein